MTSIARKQTAGAQAKGSALPGWKPYVLLACAAGALYAATSQHGVSWQDSAIFQYRIATFQPAAEADMGIALSHPALIMLGKLASLVPLGALTWRMAAVSALAGGLAVANVMLLVRRLLGRTGPWPVLAAAGFGLAHSVWWLSTITESQAIYVAVFTTELHVLVSLVRRPTLSAALLLGLLNGLALTVHDLALLALPCYGLTVMYLCLRGQIKWRAVGAFVAAWFLGSACIWAIVIEWSGRIGLPAAVRSMLFGAGWQQSVLVGSGSLVVRGAGYIVCNFPNLLLPLAAVGLWSLRRRLGGPLGWALTYLTAVYLLFAIRYNVPDQFMFFLPLYALVAVLGGLGLATLTAGGRRRWLLAASAASIAITPVLYACAPAIWHACGWHVPGRGDLPFRDPARYWLTPWKNGEDSAQEFATLAMRQAPSGATIVADPTAYWPLYFVQQIDGLRTDVQLARYDAVPPPGTPNVFVVSDVPGYCPKKILQQARLERQPGKMLFRVIWDNGAH